MTSQFYFSKECVSSVNDISIYFYIFTILESKQFTASKICSDFIVLELFTQILSLSIAQDKIDVLTTLAHGKIRTNYVCSKLFLKFPWTIKIWAECIFIKSKWNNSVDEEISLAADIIFSKPTFSCLIKNILWACTFVLCSLSFVWWVQL